MWSFPLRHTCQLSEAQNSVLEMHPKAQDYVSSFIVEYYELYIEALDTSNPANLAHPTSNFMFDL